MLSAEVAAKLQQILARDRHVELCGFLLLGPLGQQFFRCTNVSEDPRCGFAISELDASRAERHGTASGATVVALVHSHPNGDIALSISDQRELAQSSVPWIVIALDATDRLLAASYLPQNVTRTCRPHESVR